MSVRAETLGRYRLVEAIGYGGMAVVYRGYDEELERAIAVKLLADNLAGDGAFRKRFLREAQLAARLQHPNVVQVYDTDDDNGRPFIVMEYVDGESVGDLLAREGRLEPAQAIELIVQACAGLEHAHQAGLVHRDIKPQNLLLRGDGTLKIVDFGIARSGHATRLTEVGSILGTASYLAPEQAAGEDVSAAADIYSLGVVLYQMLSGRTPYSCETLPALLAAQDHEAAPALRVLAPAISAELEEIVMRCLARLPEYRPPSAAALGALLAETAPELPTRPLPRGGGKATRTKTASYPVPRAPSPALGRLRSRSNFLQLNRRAIVAAAVLAAVVIAALVALAAGGSDSPTPVQPADRPALEQAEELSQWLRARTR